MSYPACKHNFDDPNGVCPQCSLEAKQEELEQSVAGWKSLHAMLAEENVELHNKLLTQAGLAKIYSADLRAAHEEIAGLKKQNGTLLQQMKDAATITHGVSGLCYQLRLQEKERAETALTRVELLEKDKARLLQIVKDQRDARKNKQRADGRTGE